MHVETFVDDISNRQDLPMMTEKDMLSLLLSTNTELGESEPEIAASIGEQMLHMNLSPLPKSIRVRIRDICSRVPPGNATLIGGGIGHLSAWLFDLWGTTSKDELITNRPHTFRIIEPGSRFGVIIDRLIRRYDATAWAKVISRPWSEIFAETTSWNASSVTAPQISMESTIPLPSNLIIIDLPEEERSEVANSAFELLAPNGIIIVQEPEVPTGDVGVSEDGQELTPAQKKVDSFNKWIKLVKYVHDDHSIGFTEVSGGTLAVLIKKE